MYKRQDQVFSTESPEAKALARRALAFDLHLLQARCKHLGTENNLRILTNIYEGLRDKLEFSFNTEVAAIARAEGGYRLTLALSLIHIAERGVAHEDQRGGGPGGHHQKEHPVL